MNEQGQLQNKTTQNKTLLYETTLKAFTKHRQKGDTNNTDHTTPRYKRYKWRFNETDRISVDIIQLETCTDKQTDRQSTKGRASHF